MAIDDPSLLVNILGRDLRAVTKERDDLLQKIQELDAKTSATPEPDPRVKELESTNATLECQIVELETDLRSLRETAFSRLTENVDMRNRRARLKRDLQQAQAKMSEMEATHMRTEVQFEDKVKRLEEELLSREDELASERRKNKGLKDLVMKVTGQRDDAMTKLAGIRRISSVTAAPGHSQRSPTKKVHPLNITKSTQELTDALSTPLSETIDHQHPPVQTVPTARPEYHFTPDPHVATPSHAEGSPIDYDFPDLKFRSRRLNNLKKLHNVGTPPEATRPICGVQDNLDERLRILGKEKIFNPPFFIGESDIEFANPARQHGYTLRPTHVVASSPSSASQHQATQQWEPYTIEVMEPEFPSVFELFVGSLSGWIYRGTYRRMKGNGVEGELDLPNLTVGEYVDLPKMAKTRLLEQALRQSVSTSDSAPADPSSIVPDEADPFASGHVAIACVGLQCVGFNEELFDALVNMQRGNKYNEKQPHGESDVMDVDGLTPAKPPNPQPQTYHPYPAVERSSWSDDGTPERRGGHKRMRSKGGGSWTVNRRARVGGERREEDDHDQGLAKRVNKQIRTMAQVRFTGV